MEPKELIYKLVNSNFKEKKVTLCICKFSDIIYTNAYHIFMYILKKLYDLN